MAVTAVFAGLGLKDIVCGTTFLQGRPLGAVLLTGYSFNQDTHHFVTSAMANEIAQGGANQGYTTLGATVSASTVTYDAASNEIRWDFNDPTWTNATFSASQMVIYDRFSGGTTTSWPLLMYVEFGATQTVSAGTFSYVVPANGGGAITVGT